MLSMIILAGGRSSRMGTDKADLLFQGQTFLEVQIQKGRQLGIRDILVSGYRGENCGARVVPDRLKERGPLGGLEACLRQSAGEMCLVLSVDTPLVTVAVLKNMIAAHRAAGRLITILQHGGKQEPLIGVYDTRLADAMEKALTQGGGSVFAFLRETGYGVYESREDERQFQNINDPADYQRIRRI